MVHSSCNQFWHDMSKIRSFLGVQNQIHRYKQNDVLKNVSSKSTQNTKYTNIYEIQPKKQVNNIGNIIF